MRDMRRTAMLNEQSPSARHRLPHTLCSVTGAAIVLFCSMPVIVWAQAVGPGPVQAVPTPTAASAAMTPGGRGGAIVRVTSLAATGPGSFAAAVATAGPRLVVFEVGGVIDLGGSALRITEPFLTVAGQTAPSPGITFIRGGLDIRTHDVIVQHIRVRPGEAGYGKGSGHDFDAISLTAARDVIIDHCSLSWATDENLSASGPRFAGASPEDWREGTSHRVTFSHNIVAEGLAHATHAKGEHSKGLLVHDNAGDVLVAGNLFAHNAERSPLFKGGARGWVVNNLIYDPGPRAIHYNLIPAEWGARAWQAGRLVLIGNVLRAGPSTPPDVALMMVGGSGALELYEEDNLAVDRIGRPLPLRGSYTTAPVEWVPIERPPLPAGLEVLPGAAVQEAVLRDAGARPWDRDVVDQRILGNVIEGRGGIIDSEQDVGGYPAHAGTRRPFDPAAWNLEDLTPR